MNIPDKKYYADSMAFLALPGQPPRFDPSKRPLLDLAHVTSVPPLPHFMQFEAALAAHNTFRQQALQNESVHEVLTRDDVDRVGSMGLVFGMQHAPEDLTMERLRELYRAGIRVMQIAYDTGNEYGGGFKSTSGLTSKGEDLLRMMSEIGIILDLSHANHQTARDAFNLIFRERVFSESLFAPMVSHSGCHSVFSHPRNLPNDTLKDLCCLSGYVGIPAITFFLTKQGGQYVEAFARHVAHALAVGSYGIVGIGSDCPHVDMTTEQARENFANMVKMLQSNGSFGEYFPDRMTEVIERGSSMFEFFDSILGSFSGGVTGSNFASYLKHSLPRS